MLRLKYGQFLGEESESGIAMPNEVPEEEEHDHNHDHDHDHDHDEGASAALQSARELINEFSHDHDHGGEEGEPIDERSPDRKFDPSRPTWVEELSHNHDDAEVATFHRMSVKMKLRAALSEMWDAELHLRLYDPSSSLPYQYKSLALLQEIKNHARIYVHKIGFDAPAIKESERRLQGDQDEIFGVAWQSDIELEDIYGPIKQACSILQEPGASDIPQVLYQAVETLAGLALDRPELLPVLERIQEVLRNEPLEQPSIQSHLRQLLLGVLPEQEQEVSDPFNYSHSLTREIAKKMDS